MAYLPLGVRQPRRIEHVQAGRQHWNVLHQRLPGIGRRSLSVFMIDQAGSMARRQRVTILRDELRLRDEVGGLPPHHRDGERAAFDGDARGP
jgi:hypothetical protein